MTSDQEIYTLWDENTNKEVAFKLLMTTFQRDLYWHIRSIVKTHEDTDDVLQNSFIKAYRYFDSFNRDCKIYTWLYRIATNESITHLKKESKRQTNNLEEASNLESCIDFDTDGDKIKIKLESILEALPEKQRMVFNLRYFNEMSYREMSDLLGTSEGALKASYHFAVKKIESAIQN